MSVEDLKLLSSYLPLLRDLIPSAAAEIETDLSSKTSKQGSYIWIFMLFRNLPHPWDFIIIIHSFLYFKILHNASIILGAQDDYVYDYYVVHDGPEISEEHVSTAYPL